MLVPVLALSLLGLFGGHRAPRSEARVTTQVYGVERWRLQVVKDPFAGTTVCRLTAGPARVERGRLIWPLGPHVVSTNAAYRIDLGPPHVQSSLALPATANMTNPSDGLAVVPVTEIGAGRVLEVRPNPGARVRRLTVAGLDQALAAADRLGCARPSNAPDTPPDRLTAPPERQEGVIARRARQDPDARGLIVMRRIRGRLKIVRRPLPRELEAAPFWARLGFIIPLETLPFLALVAVAFALLGGAGMWLLWRSLD